MNKTDIINEVASASSLTKVQSDAAVNAVFNAIASGLKGGEVKVSNFGTFSVRVRKERLGVNPKTGERVTIPSARVIKFKPSSGLSESVK